MIFQMFYIFFYFENKIKALVIYETTTRQIFWKFQLNLLSYKFQIFKFY